jgi:dihydroorotate dehydrogenase
MGWYSAIGRPLFFSLPPEAAHRVAGALLTLPLPWRRIGGVRGDLRQAVDLAGIPLRNPIGLAAGFDKRCAHLDALGSLGFGFVVGGTVTRAPRPGNPKPRIVRHPRSRAMVNAMGLPNPGAEAAARNLAGHRRTAPRLVSISDEAVPDALETLALVAPLVDGIELNASCPNVSWGRDRDNEAHLAELVTAFRQRTERPLFVKLPPFQTNVQREVVLALASVAQERGAAGLVCSNTRPVLEPRLASGRGGLSGAPLAPDTSAIVGRVREATGGGLPIVACGGIFDADDALACLDAGATAVQIYSALIYRGPSVVGELTDGIGRALSDRDATAAGTTAVAF